MIRQLSARMHALFAASALVLATSSALAQSWPTELQSVFSLLLLDNAPSRYAARDQLTRQISQIPEPRRSDVIAELIEQFDKYQYRTQIGIAAALAKQPEPWIARDFDKQVTKLYAEFQKLTEETINREIDDALANAKGYYRDAVIDYNRDRIDDIDSVIAKFKRTVERLPKSRYVPNSIFYHGQYLTRAHLLGHSAGLKLVNDAILVLASSVRTQEKAALWDDAFYYLALDRVLVGDTAAAITTLRDMATMVSESGRVYVYQFFFSKKRGTVLDQSFPSRALAKNTQDFLREFRTISATDQDQFIAYICRSMRCEPAR